jgi:hypothetical protein
MWSQREGPDALEVFLVGFLLAAMAYGLTC